MKHKAFIFYTLISLFAVVLSGMQGCKDEAVVETQPNTNQNPDAPKLVSPVNESTINNFTPAIDWEDFNGALSYRIQISLDANFAGIMILDSSGLTTSGLNIPQGYFSGGSYYYWRVNAAISSGVTPWSAVWRFNIILPPPVAPNLISPPNGSNGQPFRPILDWNDPPDADFYRLQISSTTSFNTMLYDSLRIIVSQLQVPEFILLPNTLYFWRVNASNSGGASTSPWSAIWTFTTMDGPEPNSITGTITFVETNFLPPPEYYKVGAFEDWPPSSVPLRYDSLNITQIGNLYKADYKISRLPLGIFYVAVYPEMGNEIKVLGIYGCDTVHVNYSSCPLSPLGVEIIYNWGVENVNFLSWADTTKRIF